MMSLLSYYQLMSSAAKVGQPGEQASRLQVRRIILIVISLLLKADATVGVVGIAGDNQPDKPLYAVPQKERQDKHLQLLPPVNALTALVAVGEACPCAAAHEDEGPQSDGLEPRKWNKRIFYYNHF